MLGALSVVLLYLGSIIDIIDISMAVIASLCCVFAVIEYGSGAATLVFGVTAVLSLIIIPQKSPAVMYTFFFGFYPILKEKFEKMNKMACWIWKEAVFNVALAVIIVVIKFLLLPAIDIPFMLYVIAVVACEAVFVIYDIALTRLISLYVYKLRKRLRIKK